MSYFNLYKDNKRSVSYEAVFVRPCNLGTSHDKGPVIIGQDCATITELEYVIANMIADLESVRDEGRLYFSKTRKPV